MERAYKGRRLHAVAERSDQLTGGIKARYLICIHFVANLEHQMCTCFLEICSCLFDAINLGKQGAIALNVLRDYQRLQKFQFWKKANLATVDITDADSPFASGKPSPEARMLVGEQATHVQLALKSLSPKQRMVFIMRFLDDMEPQEISAATGMSLSTVKTHIQRAMKSVRTRLRPIL
jgi:DNA-binding CsgD family transcriptional regulator